MLGFKITGSVFNLVKFLWIRNVRVCEAMP